MYLNRSLRAAFQIVTIFVSSTWLLSSCAKPYIFPADTNKVVPRLYQNKAIMDDNYSLPLRSWGDPGKSSAIVLASHGLNDYSLSFDSTGKYLAKHNISVISYDQRGFGETKGQGYWHGSQRMVKDNLTIIKLLHEKYPEKGLFLLGESMGGAIVLAALAEIGTESENMLRGVILIAPAIWSRAAMPWYQRSLLWLAVHTFPAKALTGEGLDIMPSDNIEMLRALGRDPLVIKATRVDVLYGVTNLMDLAVKNLSSFSQNSLILYGEKDQIVPREPTCEWLMALPSTAMQNTIIYKNGYHMLSRDLQARVVLDDIASWIQSSTDRSIDVSDKSQNLPDQSHSMQNLTDFCSQ